VPQVVSHLLMKNEDEDAEYASVTIGIAQPNVDPYDKWNAGETPLEKLKELISLYDSIALDAKPDLVLFPETAIPFLIMQPSYETEWNWLKHHVDSVGIPLLSGFADIVWFERDAPPSARKVEGSPFTYLTYNSNFLLLPNNPEVQIYHKSRLTPLSERIPYLDAVPFLQNLLSWGVGISNWGLGEDTTVFNNTAHGKHANIWAMICYETLYPEFVSGFAKRSANYFGIITNDGWFGNSSGPYQLMQYSALRAIENRRAIARCANNGISCFIDSYGRITQKTTFGTRGWIKGSVSLRSGLTFYTEHGDMFAGCCAIVFSVFLLATIFWRRNVAHRSEK